MTLTELQSLLKKHNYDAYIVTRNNMYLGQDILPEENKIMELTGFSGSAGQLIVFQDKTTLLVDGRYEIQSKLETNPDEVDIIVTKNKCWGYIKKHFKDKKKITVAYNPWCHSIQDINFNQEYFQEFKLMEDKYNLLGSQLSTKVSTIFEHKIEYAGISREEKISLIVDFLKKAELDAYLFTAADSVSWLLNLRSDCLADTPLVRAYVLIDKNANYILFGDHIEGITVQPLSALEKALRKYKKNKLGLDVLKTPQKIASLKPDYKFLSDPVYELKAVKNPIELQGMKNAHLRDAIAVVNFLHWLDNNWQGKTELDIVEKLYSFRKKNELFYSNSFETIAGFGSNGAIVHYQPKTETNLELKAGSLLLLDSGAQYFDGTTDITRTIAIGIPNAKMVNDFTTVLKCHIELASAYFPEKTSGSRLDSICRRQLWVLGKDFNHGTGHGVGCFLNVHEGPQNIASGSHKDFVPGMITSIEPGYYKEGEYGIRIENLFYVDKVKNETIETPMLKFEYLTLVPIDKRLINKYLLSDGEKEWLNLYHQSVFEKLQNFLTDEVKEWLKEACSPI